MEYVPFVVLFSAFICFATCDPQACTYTETTYTYECNANNWNLPLTYQEFNYTPQVLSIINANGELPYTTPNGPTFSGFEEFNTSAVSDVTPSLYITCASGAQLILTSGTFQNMSHVKEVYFQSCTILNLAASVFIGFIDLNVLSFDRGSVDAINFNAFSGVDIYPMSGIPNPMGILKFSNSKLIENQLPNGVLFALTNIEHVVLDNVDINMVQTDMFKYNKKLRTVSMRNALITSLDTQFLDGMTSVSNINLHGINWECSCSNAWFLSTMTANNITLDGDIVCATPTVHEGIRMKTYYESNCVTINICGDMPGIVYKGECMKAFDLAAYVIFSLTIIISGVAFGMTVHFKRTEMDGVKERIQGGSLPPPPPYTLRPLSGSKWNKVFIQDDAIIEPKLEPKGNSYSTFKAMSKAQEAGMSAPLVKVQPADETEVVERTEETEEEHEKQS